MGGEIYGCGYGLFCTEFDSQQLLFEVLIWIWRVFLATSHWAPKWIYFPIFERYNISKDNNLWSALAPLLGDRHMRLLTSLYRIQCSTTFIWSIFGYNAYFCQHWARKWNYFSVFQHYNIPMMAIFGDFSSTPGGDRRMHLLTFCMEFYAQQLLFEAFLGITRIFGRVRA